MKQELVCIVCPMGCRLTLTEDASEPKGYKVSGNTCKRGIAYGVEELTNPVRVVTSTVRIQGGRLNRLPVRTDGPIPKAKIDACMEMLNEVTLESPVKMGQVVLEDLFGTGVNLIASRSL